MHGAPKNETLVICTQNSICVYKNDFCSTKKINKTLIPQKKFSYTLKCSVDKSFWHYKYKKRLLLRCIHHFKSDLINSMDHMSISGNEPSSVILRQKVVSKVENVDPKVPKEAEAKRDGVIHPHNYNFNHFYGNLDALKRYESTEVDRRTWLHVPSGTHWSTSSDTHQVVEI